MVDTKKFSEFVSGGTLEEGQETVGLESGTNARFTTPPQFLPSGTTAQRPSPATEGMIRYNTSLQQYEYYDGTQWVQIESSSDIAVLIARLAAHTPGDGASMIGLEDQGAVSNKTVQELSESTFVVKDGKSALINAIELSALSTGFIVVETATGNLIARSLAPTSNQIVISNTDGLSGDPQISIADNPELSGNSHVRIPFGTTAQRPGVPMNGYVRYNTDLNDLEFWNANTVAWEQTASTGALTAIVQDTTPQLGGTLDANGFEIDMASQKITSVLDPSNPQDAATKNYADSITGSKPIADVVSTGVSVVDFTGLNTNVFAYKFVLSNVRPVTDGTSFQMRLSTDNGATFITSSSYTYRITYFQGASTLNNNSGSSSAFALNTNTGNVTGESVSGEILLINPAFSNTTKLVSNLVHKDSFGVVTNVFTTGQFNSSQSHNAVRFKFATGNIDIGIIAVYPLMRNAP